VNTQIKYIFFQAKKRLKIAEFSDYVPSPSLQLGVEKEVDEISRQEGEWDGIF
jgi:hypothetical protein